MTTGQASATAAEFAFRDIRPGDTAALVRLAQAAVGASWTEQFVRWKYFRNPTGGVTGCLADAQGSLVGFYGGVPVGIKVGDRRVLGAQVADAMVSPAMRRRGLFTRMGRHTVHRLTDAGAELLYAMANPLSLAGSVKHLGFSYAGEIPNYVKVVDAAAVAAASGLRAPQAWLYRAALNAVRLARRPEPPPQEGVRVREVFSFDERFDRLWEAASRPFDIAVVRGVAYLDWRYAQNPLRRYTILVAERDDALLGYTVLSFRDAAEKGTIALAELLLAPGETAAGLALLGEAARRAREGGHAQLQCWMLPQHAFYTRLLRRCGFVYAPFRLMPGVFRQTTSFITRLPEGCTMVPDPARLENWFVTMGDQDYY